MLRMSKLTDYGIVIMSYLAKNPGQAANAADISATVHVALPTVSKILKTLARGGLLASHRGSKGGYSLARAPQDISVIQIIDALEGPVAVTQCSVQDEVCEQEQSCSIRQNWRRINDAIRHTLDGITLVEMNAPPTVPLPFKEFKNTIWIQPAG